MSLRLLHSGRADIVSVFNVCLEWSVAPGVEGVALGVEGVTGFAL